MCPHDIREGRSLHRIRLNTIRARFVATSIFLVLFCTVLLSAGISYLTAERLRGDVGKFLAETAFQIADKADRGVWSRTKEVLILSQLDALREASDVKAIQTAIDTMREALPIFTWIGFTDPDGKVVAASQGVLAGSSIAHRPVFRQALEKMFIGVVHDAVMPAQLLPNTTGEPMKFVDIGVPVRDGLGRFKGVLATHLSWEWVREMNQSFLSILREDQIDVFIVSADKTVLLGPQGTMGLPLDLPILEDLKSGQNGWQVQTWPDGGRYLTGGKVCTGYLEYTGLGWTILIRQPMDAAYAPVLENQMHILVAGLLMTIFAVVIAISLARFVTSPLESIAADARRLRDGELAEFPAYRGIAEIEVLSASLREMVGSLARTRGERDRMERLAMVDKLTDLPNRAQFERYVSLTESEPLRRNESIGILFMDLDGFKSVNDNLGHDAGDKVLQEVAERLRTALRGHDRAVRLGGDEFVLIVSLDRGNSRQEAEALAKRLIETINVPMDVNGHRVRVGCSIGVAFYPDHDDDLRKVIAMADANLNLAKSAGKNQAAYS